MIDAKRDFDRSLEELLAGGIVKSGEKIIDPCFYCGESTAFGYGKFINRVGYIDNDFNGWACAECAGYECRVCEEQIYLDEDLRWSDDLSHCLEECLSEEQNQIITMFFELGGDWELPFDDAEAWFTQVIESLRGEKTNCS